MLFYLKNKSDLRNKMFFEIVLSALLSRLSTQFAEFK